MQIELWGVPNVVQWGKNMTALAWVPVETWVWSLAQELPYAVGVAIKKKEKRRKERSCGNPKCLCDFIGTKF